jgi:hypothetical protein
VGWLPWKDALAIAIPLLLVGFAWRPRARAPRTLAALLREGGVVMGLYALWTWMGALSLRHIDGAMSHGEEMWHLERILHLPSEVSVQRPFLGHPGLVHLLDQYYAWVHVPAIGAFLLWLFLRHRARYPEWRTSLAILTGLCFLIQLVPVAPPRMFPGDGFVDTGVAFGDSVYGRLGEPGPAQLSAMRCTSPGPWSWGGASWRRAPAGGDGSRSPIRSSPSSWWRRRPTTGGSTASSPSSCSAPSGRPSGGPTPTAARASPGCPPPSSE